MSRYLWAVHDKTTDNGIFMPNWMVIYTQICSSHCCMKPSWTSNICFAIAMWKIQLKKKLGCLVWHNQWRVLCSAVQLFCASCNHTGGRAVSQSKPWDTSFPLVILSLHNQRDDDICSDQLTLGSVWTTAHREYTPSRPHALTHTNTTMSADT